MGLHGEHRPLVGPVAIVGAGPAGLTLARILSERGVPFTVFEKEAAVGGLWNLSAETPIYDSAHLISSKTKTGFDGFPMPDAYPDYPSAKLVERYINAFTDAAGLRDHIRLSTPVERATPLAEGWRVTAGGRTQDFAALVCCTGQAWKGKTPDWPGEFDGEILHSFAHQRAADLAGKRVLVVGAGNSGADIACDAAQAADFAGISMRRGYHFIPKSMFGIPADVYGARSEKLPLKLRQRMFGALLRILHGDLTKLGLPRPDHRILASHPLVNDQLLHHLRHGDVTVFPDVARLAGAEVEFTDGTREAFDTIICATGYAWEAPYLPDDALPWANGRVKLPFCVFAPGRKDLYALSFIKAAGSSITLFHEMAWIVARSIEARAAGAPALEARLAAETPDYGGPLAMVASDRHDGYVERLSYLRALRGLRKQMGWPVEERCRPLTEGVG